MIISLSPNAEIHDNFVNLYSQLENEVQKLTMRLQDQIEEERLILMRRERESQEGQNLELMLKSDLERVDKSFFWSNFTLLKLKG